MQPIPLPPVVVPRARWKPPSADFVKINVDGVVFLDENKSGIGVVIHNHQGQVLASQSLKLHQAYSPGVIEAMVVHSGITIASNIGFHKAVVEGYSKVSMTVLQQGREILTPDGLLIKDIRLSSTLFTQLHYSQTKREDNKVTHSLARYVLHVFDAVVWMEDVPPQVVSVLQADLANIH